MFQPKYLKNGKLLRKGVKKFLHYKRDLISEENLQKIEEVVAEFDEALESKDKGRIEKAAKHLTGTCEKAVPSSPNSGLRENLEVIFVAVVIAVGIRAYFLQPFKIPTGSMQPTLNGIIAHQLTEQDYAQQKPGMVGKAWEFVFAGRNYVNEVMEEDKTLVRVVGGTRLKFFPFTRLYFDDGSTREIKVPLATLMGHGGDAGTGFGFSVGQMAADGRVSGVDLERGQVIARGYVDTGDQVLVDKLSYHFRKPKRGEVFVFSTKNIAGIQVPPEQGSQHYIKRLVGVPGDKLEVRDPRDASGQQTGNGELFIDYGQGMERATEPGMVRVMEAYPKTHPATHGGYEFDPNPRRPPLTREFDLTGKREYVAMGDNSRNSADSRSWGTVPEVNIVGPAFVVYWPFAHHWGRIR